MEIKINKEIRQYRESIFFGLSLRQLLCSIAALGIAVGIYFALRDVLGESMVGWVCILCAAPVAITGFFKFNGLTFEQFVWTFIKSELLCTGKRVYKAENIYLKLLSKKGAHNDD